MHASPTLSNVGMIDTYTYVVYRYMATNEACTYFYHRVQVHIPQPVELVMLTTKPHSQGRLA